MGEHTIREVLKRRSDDTQRVIRRRRERAEKKTGTRRRSYGVLAVFIIIVLVIIALLAYSGWLITQVNGKFSADRATNAASNNLSLNLQSTTQFLPNTLLAATDPNFYNHGTMTISPVTGSLVRMYFPEASTPEVNLMVVALQYGYSRTDILETFINDVPMGNVNGRAVRGFAAASQAYFKKPFVQLQPQDIALLVALATHPTLGDPRQDTTQALALRNLILQMDAQQGVLSQAQVDAFKKTPLDLAP